MKKVRERQLDLSLPRRAGPTLDLVLDEDEPWADNFAGGGGVGEALKRLAARLGLKKKRGADVAVNHWDAALTMHEANHPECAHHCEDITKFDMVAAAKGRRYSLAWFSPTCIFFSQAKGGPLDESATKVRGLAWLACSWAASEAKPRALVIENVPPFLLWGPLHRQHSQGCSKEIAHERGKTLKNGKHKPKCLKGCNYLRPIKARIGTLFNAFIRRLRTYYKFVTWRVLRAHDYGAPTSRKRVFVIASDTPPAWPTPTHGPGLTPYRTAAECLDWTIPCPSIFERETPLVETTEERIRAGFKKFVLGAARPFVVHVTHGGRAHDVDGQAPTITGANRGELGLVAPALLRYNGQRDGEARGQRVDDPASTIDTANRLGLMTPLLIHRGNGERRATETTAAQAPRCYDVQKPIGTIVAQGEKHALVTPYLVKNYSEREGGFAGGSPVDKAIGTITGQDHHSLAMPHLMKLRGTSDAHVEASAHSVETPLDTIAAQGTHHALVMAYVVRYNGASDGQQVDAPLSTIDTKDRFALVELTLEREVCNKALRVAKFLGYEHPIILELDGIEWVLVDIGFRMLVPRELFNCQGFPPDYDITPLFRGKPMTKTAQTKCVGNSVPPDLAEAVAYAAVQTIRYDEPEVRRAA